MSEIARSSKAAWFHPSEKVLDAVRAGLEMSRKRIVEQAAQRDWTAMSDQSDSLETLIHSNAALENFVVRAVAGAFGTVLLENQRDKPVSVIVAERGRLSDGVVQALKHLLPQHTISSHAFLEAVYRDVFGSMARHGNKVALGRSMLVLSGEKLRLDIAELEPSQLGRRVSATIEVLVP